MTRTLTALVFVPVLLLLTGCFAGLRARPAYAGTVVYQAPPPARAYARPPAPYSNAVWMNGYWGWYNGRYAWNAGHWAHARAGQVYVQPTWVRRGQGWAHSPGHWQRRGRAVVRRGAVRPNRAVVVDRGPTRGDVRRARRQGRREGRQDVRQNRRSTRPQRAAPAPRSGVRGRVRGSTSRSGSSRNRPTVEVR